MAPYRTAPRTQHAEAPRDTGIVGDIIAQFADPLAFYRELVQNAIDAGSPTIDVRIEHDGPAGVVRATVRDRGEGMTRDVLENQLLVLFRSTKEGAAGAGKIGKFGIGFTSVLAPDPDVVVVQSTRDGRRLVLHLQRDLSYQLFDGGPATQHGTSVELEIPIAADAVSKFVDDSIAALRRWCRHATVPIELHALVEPARQLRIDEPLALTGALVQVRTEVDGLTALVGIGAGGAPYSGFFNHGLLLYEAPEPLAGSVMFKIQDARLGHTISRDNVRRDERFDFAIATVKHVVATQLEAACVAALRDAAEDADRTRYHALVGACAAVGFGAAAAVYPLVEPVHGRRSIATGELPAGKVYGSGERDAITALLAAHGMPVLDLADVHSAAVIRTQLGSDRVIDVRQELTLVTLVTPASSDTLLLDTLRDLLAAAFRAPPAIQLAKLDGALAYLLGIGGGESHATLVDADGRMVFDRDAEQRSIFARLRPVPLLLSVDHPHVVAARGAVSPQVAAAHLARAVLLAHKALDGERSATLLERTLAMIGVRR